MFLRCGATCGLTIGAKTRHTLPKGQVKTTKVAQLKMAGYESLGACIFAAFGFTDVPETISELVNARYGTAFSVDLLKDLGRETIPFEREFNCRAGFTSSDYRFREWMTWEPLPPHETVFDVPEEELDHVFKFEADRESEDSEPGDSRRGGLRGQLLDGRRCPLGTGGQTHRSLPQGRTRCGSSQVVGGRGLKAPLPDLSFQTQDI